MADADLMQRLAREGLDVWWRAANYLSAAQLYLLGDPFLREPLTPLSIKPRLLGHWGTVPALNLLWAHANRVIRERRSPMIYVAGPGHGGNAILANAWLEGTYSELFPQIGRDGIGAARLAPVLIPGRGAVPCGALRARIAERGR